jgi:hypothetical protein
MSTPPCLRKCHACGRSRPAILQGPQDEADGERRDGWEFVPEGWMCPLCLIMSTSYRSRLPADAPADESEWMSRRSLDAVAERFGVSSERVRQLAVEAADPMSTDE